VNQSQLCECFGKSRQGFSKKLHRSIHQRELEDMAVSIVQDIRYRQPRVGTRKLILDVNHKLVLNGFEPIGRDHLFDVLRERDLLVKPLKRFVKTTNSYHRFRKHKNLLLNTKQTGPNQAYVADITYLRIQHGFCYLSLLTDVYSRKIVGFYLSKDLGAHGPVRALKMALKQCSHPQSVIHHSDRGIQYCCDMYAEILEKNKMCISMTEANHCYENSLAERVNETLKYDLMLGEVLPSFSVALKAVKEAVKIYNNERRHVAIEYLTPQAKHAA
jgi:transposase InsO family protein